MILVITQKATQAQIEEMSKLYSGYTKLVIDVEKNILAAGAERHFEEELELLKNGSNQENLWGGGIDWETKEIDYNSMINLRPAQANPSRDILSIDVRAKFDEIVKQLLL